MHGINVKTPVIPVNPRRIKDATNPKITIQVSIFSFYPYAEIHDNIVWEILLSNDMPLELQASNKIKYTITCMIIYITPGIIIITVKNEGNNPGTTALFRKDRHILGII